MRTFRHSNRTILAIAAFVIAAASVTAQLEIVRSTMDGGGGMNSTGGNFELSGTIGQPDAGVMSAGNFELTGGFWLETPPTDCNEDGVVTLHDHDRLMECLSGPNAVIPSGCECFDATRNGRVDLRDAAASQNHFSGS